MGQSQSLPDEGPRLTPGTFEVVDRWSGVYDAGLYQGSQAAVTKLENQIQSEIDTVRKADEEYRDKAEKSFRALIEKLNDEYEPTIAKRAQQAVEASKAAIEAEVTAAHNARLAMRTAKEISALDTLVTQIEGQRFRAPSTPLVCQREQADALECYRSNAPRLHLCDPVVRIFSKCVASYGA